MKSYREESRKDYGEESTTFTKEALRTGGLLRIADSCEAVVKDRLKLERDLEFYKKRAQAEAEESLRLAHVIAGLRGYIVRLKRGMKR